jgi:alpha-L-fucosidase
MFDSELTDYQITNTPYQRDVMDALAKECHRRGVKLFFYYSPLDWHHPAYNSNWDAYTHYWHGQVLELFRKYQPAGIWLDGCWNKPDKMDETWKLTELYREVRKISPGAIIGNNHHQAVLPDEDIQTFEQDLPGENKAGFNKTPPLENTLIETCMTINNNWGYHAADHAHKSVEQLIRILATCAGRDSNLLLNVGPKPDGTIQPEFVERLQGMGDWLKRNGEAIYGTRGRVFGETPWGTATRKDKTIYLHVWNPGSDGWLEVEVADVKIRSARLLATHASVPFEQTGSKVRLRLPPLPDPADTVCVIS